MAHGLFTTKPISDLHEAGTGNELHRALDARALVMLGIGAIIGTGIFVLTGTAAANHAGPALVLSFVIAGIGCAFAGLCYAEFAAMIPVSGSAYSYSYVTLGEFVAWFVGWNLILEYLFAAATIAVGWSGYVVSLMNQLGVHLPDQLTNAPFTKGATHYSLVATGAIINLPAVLILCVMSALCYIGIHQSARFNGIVVAIKVTVIVLFIGFGAWYVQGANWDPFIPPNTGPGHFGWSGVVTAAGIIFFAYIGFDAVSTAAQEAKNPQRDMPIGILASLAICTVLYISVAAVLTGMVPYLELNTPAPVALALDRYPALSWLAGWVKLGAIAGMTSTMLVMLLGQPRIFYAMARDGLLPPVFARVHPKFKTPSFSTVLTGVVAATVAGLLPVTILGELVSIGTLMAFVVVCIGVLVLRRTRPDLERPFRVKAPWLVCTAGALICSYMMIALPFDTWVRLVVWTFFGLLVYFLYGRKHSKLDRRSS
ncbi:MAG TPA: amino acid permease [Steroidobacteraceae bacterium]|nr:amino acid permease [Steroidobacteraceae bacterium]